MSRAASLRFWWRHLRMPLAAFVLLSAILATTTLDLSIARALYFDAGRMQWIGAGNWWINEFIHTGGRWFIRGVVAAALTLLIATCLNRDLRGLRRPTGYFVVAVVLSVGVVGLLKTLTNVDCPWDLVEFGGRFPFVALFADRPDELRHGHCFPAAHASSGYALLALYFALRERHEMLARLGLALGVITGLVFGIAQQSRGAHFVSHDVWSAFLVWAISLSIYAFMFKARLWDSARRTRSLKDGSLEDRPGYADPGYTDPGYVDHDAPVAAGRLVVGGIVDMRDRTR